MKDILRTYMLDKSTKHPLSGKKLSKSKRIDNMYSIVQNYVYGKKYTQEERVFASKLITEILQED